MLLRLENDWSVLPGSLVLLEENQTSILFSVMSLSIALK
jgi:hypothetical protein